MKYEVLIKWCRRTIKSYNPVIDTIDTHAETYLKEVSNSWNNSLNIFRYKMIMKESLSDKYFMVVSVIVNSLKHLTKFFSVCMLLKQIEMMELFMEYTFIYFALDLMNYL